MKIHPFYGPILIDKGWVPAPRYLMRRDLILAILKGTKKAQLLEIGTGPAALHYELSINGLSCFGLEQSQAALKIAHSLHKKNGLSKIYREPQPSWKNRFDWVMAFEVLEHIEDDISALIQWRNFLKPGGHVLISVPAHQNKWNMTDIWAGHFRRYERIQLQELFEKCGFIVDDIFCYGFPIANIIEPIRSLYHGKLLQRSSKHQLSDENKKNKTDQSGIHRSLEKKLFPLYSNPFGVLFMRIAFWMQQQFLQTDLGTGYIVQARRTNL